MIFQVILVSNAPTGQTNILQRSLNMTIMRGTSTVSGSGSSIPHVIQRSGSVEGLPPHIIQQRAPQANLGNSVTTDGIPAGMSSKDLPGNRVRHLCLMANFRCDPL